jgi:hypothetical protein
MRNENISARHASDRPVTRAVALFFLGLGVTTGPAASAQAQQETVAHPRRASFMSLQGDAPGVWIADDRVWVPSVPPNAVSVCAGGRCLPIAETLECEPPECPGRGTLVVAAGPLGSIDDFPDDPEAFDEELQAMRADPGLATVAGNFGAHPDYDADEDDGSGMHPSFALGVAAASQSRGAALVGGAAAAGFLYHFDTDEGYASSDDGSFFATMFGDRLGFEVRARAFYDRDAEGDPFSYAIGGAIVLDNRVAGSMFQVPSFLGLLLPELGVFVRGERPSFYGGMSFPVKAFATGAFALELRATALLVAVFENDQAGALLSLSMQGVLQ